MTNTIIAETDEEREARFVADHPEISAAIPGWADEVMLDLATLERDGEASFVFSREVGTVEIAGSGRWAGGVVTMNSNDVRGLYIPDHEHNEPTPQDLAAYARLVAADLQRAAGLLDAEVAR